ncbi:MAG: relaxase/mobilization nuclease domain-containing protein [Eubacterium sp.]|nr:relaxase/mobilization nuclease domain-containing protein [Eubacterium sp.]
MATTGFWPVKCSLKAVIEYANNPDKTTDKRYLDDDLAKALEYVSNDDKTDQKMFVSGINCSVFNAYQKMMATKRKFGKLSGNVAYHGYQSFDKNEVTPEEAHLIGVYTAKKMWGDEYEVVVTTHLNTDNIHNHFVVNSVSFKTGKKFQNKIEDHIKLREISDSICRFRGKTVLHDAPFYSRKDGEYWLHKNGKLTHRDILRQDIDEAIKKSHNFQAFQKHMIAMGYKFKTSSSHHITSVIAEGWQRPVRFSSLGKGYSLREIYDTIMENRYVVAVIPPTKPKQTPLLILEKKYKEYYVENSLVAIVRMICELIQDSMKVKETQPVSPLMRQEIAKLDERLEEYEFLNRNDIHTFDDFYSVLQEIKDLMNELEMERDKISNRIRRPKPDTDIEALKQRRKEISAELKPIRKDLKIAERFEKEYPHIQKVLSVEREKELENQGRRERNWVRL